MSKSLFLILIIGISFAADCHAKTYPQFVRTKVERFRFSYEHALAEVNQAFAIQMGKSPDEVVIRSEELRDWIKRNREWTAVKIKDLRDKIPLKTWQIVESAGRMPLPEVLGGNSGGIISGLDNLWSIYQMADDEQSALAMCQYAGFFQCVFDHDPEQAFSLMAESANESTITTSSIIDAEVALSYWPGEKLSNRPSKKDWKALYASVNSSYRLIALEKFDSVEQSPEELLALYRECLFGACSYLEVRALEGIMRNKDFREEVAKLLEEYIASNPSANDGTLPHLRNNFPNLIEGAQRVIAMIRGTAASNLPATMPTSDPIAERVKAPEPSSSSALPDALPQTVGKKPDLKLWLIIGGIALIAFVFLGRLLHKRQS